MIYDNHNLFENLKNIKGTKDMRISRELILSEITKVISSRPYEVRGVLISCGIAIGDRPSKLELVRKVGFNAGRSKCLRTGLGNLIAKNQMPFMGDPDAGYSNQAGGNDWGKVIGEVIGTGFGIWQTGQSRKEGASQRNHDMELAQKNIDLMTKQMELQQKLAEMPQTNQAGPSSTSSLVTILLALAAVGVIGFAIWSSKREAKGSVAIAPATSPVV